jgi:hypothetical protein
LPFLFLFYRKRELHFSLFQLHFFFS